MSNSESLKAIIKKEPYKSFIKIFDMAYILDLTGNIVHVTGNIKKVLGYTVKEVTNTHFKDYIGIKEIPIALSIFKDIALGRDAKGVSLNLRSKEKGEVKITLNTVPIIVDGKIIGVIGNVVGASEDVKKVQEKLKESEERYRKAQKLGHVGNWEYDPVTTNFWASDEARRIYGFSLNDDSFSTEKVEKCILERKRVHQALVNLLTKNEKYDLEFDVITHNTRIRKTIHSIAEVERDSKGKPLRVTGVIEDITKRKKEEEEKNKIEEYSKTIIENMGDGLFIVDLKGVLIELNSSLLSMLGYEDEKEFLKKNKTALDLLIPEEKKRAIQGIADTFKKGFDHVIYHAIKKDGSQIIVDLLARATKDNKGNLISIVTVRDITEKKKAEAELQEKFVELEKMNKLMIGRELKMVELKNKIKNLELSLERR